MKSIRESDPIAIASPGIANSEGTAHSLTTHPVGSAGPISTCQEVNVPRISNKSTTTHLNDRGSSRSSCGTRSRAVARVIYSAPSRAVAHSSYFTSHPSTVILGPRVAPRAERIRCDALRRRRRRRARDGAGGGNEATQRRIGRGDRPEDRARDQQCRQHPSGISDDHIKNCTRKLRKNLSSHLALAFLYTSRGSAAGAAACPPPPRTTRDATRCRPSDSDSRRWRVALEMKLGLGHAVVLSWVMRSCSENLVSGMVPP